MNDLSPEARSLLASARATGVPTASRRHNIKHAVLLRAAAVTAASAGAGAVGATSLTAKLVLVGILASAVSGGAFGVWKLRRAGEGNATPPSSVAKSSPATGKTRPALVETNSQNIDPQNIGASTERPRVQSAGHEPAREVTRSPTSRAPVRESHLGQAGSPSPSPAPPPKADKGLADEVAQLRRAHEALRDGLPALALKILADYDRDFPHGALSEERGAIAAIAGCQRQPGPSAKAQARSFLRSAPSSLLGERVRAACFPGAEVSPK